MMNPMRFSRLCLFLAISILVPLCSISRARAEDRPNTAPELRAFWVDGFNDGFMTPEQCDTLMARLRAMHCNAVFVQMRKRGDAYYASHYEPWATDDTGRFDALDYLCRIAHAPGKPYIQVHAWVNACAVGGSHNPKGVALLHPEWRSVSDTGSDFDGESTKIDPGIPGAADWTYRVYMDIVRHYPIDGIHMDFIRYGGDNKTAGHWGYSPISIARYHASIGMTGENLPPPVWNDPSWMQWRRDQVTALVRRISLGAIALRPKIVVSAATICWGDGPIDDVAYEQKSAAYTEVFADWRGWMREGLLDLNCPMTYVNIKRHPTFWAHWVEFVKEHQYDRLSAMGIGAWLNDIPGTVQEIEDTRTLSQGSEPNKDAKLRPAAGWVIFSYATNDTLDGKDKQYDPDFYAALGQAPISESDVDVPAMPWKTQPQLGGIDGYVLNANDLSPSDGQRVSLRSPNTNETAFAIVDGNGYFGFANLKPGIYNIGSTPRHGGKYWSAQVRVIAGSVTHFTPPDITSHKVAGTGALTDGSTVTYVGAVVTTGSDVLGNYFFVADGIGKPVVRVDAPGLVMPTVAGDKVVVRGTVHHAGATPVIEATTVRYIGAMLIP